MNHLIITKVELSALSPTSPPSFPLFLYLDVTMDNSILLPNTTETPPLPSFASLRSRNLATLYEVGTDKSPKGFIDAKIAPLCHLINSHDEYVTTSSCSGRVALFDPGVADSNEEDEDREASKKSTKLSGKGRGQWRFVTHDVLSDLGSQLVAALEEAVRERSQHISTNNHSSILTLKYEPPLLHIAAASLPAGQKMLKLFKSVCRESGLMVTDERVTVEIRTMGTALCVPIFISENDNTDKGQGFELNPSEQYLKNLADIMNERMVQNEALLARLYNAVKEEMFFERDQRHIDADHYEIQLHQLPSLNLWKTAAVALAVGDSQSSDIDVISFGGQGIGPNNSTTCQRWDKMFCLKRRDGVWSDCWDDVKLIDPCDESLAGIRENGLVTNAGTYKVETVKSLGQREGHTACILPSIKLCNQPLVVIFGGRTGGPSSPTNDLFLFTLQHNSNDVACGILCKPSDVRGPHPSARFGHTMTVLQSCCSSNQDFQGGPLAMVSGGNGIANDGSNQALSSVYVLSCCKDDGSNTCHLLWERIQDMQIPRVYHASVRVPLESGNDGILVFGGISQSDDPFCDANNESDSYCELLTLGSNNVNPITVQALSSVIGGAACYILGDISGPDASAPFILAGGEGDSELPTSSRSRKVLTAFRWSSGRKAVIPVRSSAYLVTSEDGDQTESDLGVCVHHCLLTLPNQSVDAQSAILVGGGVPSFSFGQSYAK